MRRSVSFQLGNRKHLGEAASCLRPDGQWGGQWQGELGAACIFSPRVAAGLGGAVTSRFISKGLKSQQPERDTQLTSASLASRGVWKAPPCPTPGQTRRLRLPPPPC